MSAQHTPGPWGRNIKPASHYPTIFAGRNTHVAVVARRPSEDEMDANADLIAAAPEMLAVLKKLTADIDLEELCGSYHKDWQEAVRVIAKAEGRG